MSFRPIPGHDQQLIEDQLEERTYKEADYLFRTHHICKELFFIRKGILRIVIFNEEGKEVTYFFLEEGQICTILNSFSKEILAEQSIRATCDSEV